MAKLRKGRVQRMESKAIALFKKGIPKIDIAEELGISISSVAQYARRLGYTNPARVAAGKKGFYGSR